MLYMLLMAILLVFFKWNDLDVVLTINDTNQKSRVYIISEDNTIYTDGIETNVNELIFTNIQQFFSKV